MRWGSRRRAEATARAGCGRGAPGWGRAPALWAPFPTPLDSGPVSGYGACFHSNRPCRLAPAHQGMKSRSCGLVPRIGTVDSATPHPDPSGGQAPRLAKSSTALHFLIPPSTIGLQFGTFRRRRAGIEGDWRAHPGSESGTCFRANDEMGAGKTKWGRRCGAEVGGGIAIDVLTRCDSAWIPARYRGTGHAFDRENDEAGSRIEDNGRPVHGGRYQAGVVAAGCFSP